MNEKYKLLFEQVKALCEGETNSVAKLSNIAALLHDTFPERFFWVGFYMVEKASDELVLGPFQGPVACFRIKRGKGVCGTAWQQKQSIVVADVEQFPGHIACSSLSRSEIVVPIVKAGEVVGVIDIDSRELDTFGEVDREWLEKVAHFIATF